MTSQKKFTPTESTIDNVRLYVLLQDIGCPVLRDLMIRLLGEVTLEQHLSNRKEDLEILKDRRILFDEQFSTLFPNGNAADSSESFDLSLLICLLRSACGLRPSNDDIWKVMPADTNVSLEENITRLRLYRNAIFHQSTSALQQDNTGQIRERYFEVAWNAVKKAILELDDGASPGLESQIDDLKTMKIMVARADEFKIEAERWTKQYHNNALGLTELVLASLDRKLFVKTKTYEKAQKKLQKNRMVVLKGNPGEGKTTMSRMLALDLGIDKKVINVSSRSDWRKVDITDDTVIIIDDIFGASVFDANELKKWNQGLTEIGLALKNQDSKLRVIVTSRSYILNEALLRMYQPTFFTNENTVNISSEQLSDEEREEILTKHLEKAERKSNQEFVKENLKCQDKDSDGSHSFPIGFPECARLFSQEISIFQKGPKFFQKPLHYLKKRIKKLFESDETVFFAYFLIWAQQNHELQIRDIEMPIEDTPDYIKTVIQKLQVSPEQCLRHIGRRLEQHKEGFLTFNGIKGLYRFSHRVIADVVGLVAFEINATSVLSCCDFDFSMRYIRLQKHISDTLHVAPFRFTCLSRALVEFMKIEEGQLDGTVIQHEAFCIKEFCQNFIVALRSRFCNYFLSVPVQTVFAFFMQSEFEPKHEELRLASFSLYKGGGKSVFAELCFDMKIVPKDVLEKELYISVMIAIKFGSIESLKWLFQHGAKVADEMVILATRENKNDVFEFLRQKLDDGNDDVSRGWNSTSYPNPMVWLIQNHKTAAVDILTRRHDDFKVLKIKNMDSTALHVACFYGETEIAEMIIEKYPMLDKENEQGYYPIQIAVKKGHTETVMSLLNKTDYAHKTLTLANKDNIKGLTLLHIAIWSDDEILAEKLAETGHFTNKVDAFQRTAMLFALNGGKHRCIKKLLESDKVDKETPDRDGNTPLHIAILKAKHDTSYTQYAKRLSEMVDVNKQNKDGNTPLHLAFAMKQPAIKKELLENPNIKKDIVNKKNKTPSQMLELSNPDSKISDEEDEI